MWQRNHDYNTNLDNTCKSSYNDICDVSDRRNGNQERGDFSVFYPRHNETAGVACIPFVTEIQPAL